MIIKLAIFAILVCFAFAQGPPFDEPCQTTAWPPKPETTVPTYTIDLDLPPQQRWLQIGTQYKTQVQALLAYFKTFLLEFSPKLQKLIDIVDNDLGKIVPDFPAPYGDEMIGLANATELPLGDIVLFNIFYEFFTACTSIVAQDPNGRIMHARNLDFGIFMGWDIKNDTWQITELLRPATIMVNFTSGGQLQYTMTTFVGFIGSLTGVKPNAFSITINDRFQLNGGYIGLFEWITNVDRNQSFVSLLTRDLLATPDATFDDAVNALANKPIMAPVYYTVAGTKPLQGAVVTRDRAKAVDVWRLGTNNTWFIAETNYDHWDKPLFVDDRITPTNQCMTKMGQDKLSFDGVFNVLSTKPVLNKLSVYTSLIDVETGHIESYTQNCPDPCWFV